MNWYYLIKFANIWNININSPHEYIISLYQLEYYKTMMERSNIFPKRKENILNQINKKLLDVSKNVKNILIKVFKNWLDDHALLNPDLWSRKVLEREYSSGYNYSSILTSIMYYYIGLFKDESINTSKFISKIIRHAVHNPEKYSEFSKYINNFINGYKLNVLMEDLNDEGYEEFGERYNQEFKNREEAEEFINSMDIQELDVEDMLYFEDTEDFVNMLENNNIDVEKVIKEILKNICFPIWYSHWKERGIENTRKIIENVYKDLLNLNINNTENVISTINIALNTAHQGGMMSEYFDELDYKKNPIDETLELLTSGYFVPEWNEDLKDIGVNV